MAREARASDGSDVQGGRTPLTQKAKALLAGATAREKLADDVVVLDVSSLTAIADFLVICSGDSVRQVKAVADAVDEALAREGVTLLHSEGVEHGQWVLLDYGDLVVHVFHRDTRQFYRLESLWGDAARVPLPPELAIERRYPPSPSPRGSLGDEVERFQIEG